MVVTENTVLLELTQILYLWIIPYWNQCNGVKSRLRNIVAALNHEWIGRLVIFIQK
jgi:hypothetical protein